MEAGNRAAARGKPPPTAAIVPQLIVRNSTVSGNDAGVAGGGVALAGFTHGNVLVVANSTVTDNAAGENSPILATSGGGIHVAPASNTTPSVGCHSSAASSAATVPPSGRTRSRRAA